MADNITAYPTHSQDTISLAHLVSLQDVSQPFLPALIVNDQKINYRDLIKRTQQLAFLLKKNNIQRLGVLASKSFEAYLAVLAAHWLGIAYVPLNPFFPVKRLRDILKSAEIDGVVVDDAHLAMVNDLKTITLSEILAAEVLSTPPSPVKASDLAYLIFTSGSTGTPKGVPITFGNLTRFIKTINERYTLTNTDKISQFSALSFDVSIFDMCMAFSVGAALYVVPESTQLAPAKFINENHLTVWLSVPSIINNMARLKMLRDKAFPSLKYSLFTGEALTLQQIEWWQVTAPHSRIENLYGPTEATIDCLGQIYDKNQTDIIYRDQLAIGKPFPEILAALIDDKENFLKPGERGQLIIAGPQLTTGYWHDDKLTAQKFKDLLHPDWGIQRWFLTGDYCYQDNHGVFYYLNRLDNQVKFLGNRVELEEIEFTIRTVTGCDAVAACLVTVGESPELVAVTNSSHLDKKLLTTQLKERLPPYMMPTRIIYKEALFYNANGKLDRLAIKEWVTATLNNSVGGAGC